MVYKYDFLIIGSGVAGMSYALKVARAHKGKVCMICKTSLDEANTSFAQGGVASVTNLEVDNFDKHIQDTMIAGDYISDYKAVKQVVTMAPEQIQELVQWGVNFDKQQDGKFDLHREGGHSEFRILHHADDTGAEIQRGLMEAVRNCPDIDIKENHFAVEIITQHHLGARVTRRTPYINCYGAYVLNPDTQKVDTYLSKVTVMCTADVVPFIRLPPTLSSLRVMARRWFIVPRVPWPTWSSFSSTLQPSIIQARLIQPSSSPRRCVDTVASCVCLTARASWRNMMSA